MKMENLLYLKEIIGEDASKYINSNYKKTEMLINVLKNTNISKILDLKTFQDFCYKIVNGAYGKTFFIY